MVKNAFLYRSADSTLVCSIYIGDSNRSFKDSNRSTNFHFFIVEKTFWNMDSNHYFRDSNRLTKNHIFTSGNTFWNMDSNRLIRDSNR